MKYYSYKNIKASYKNTKMNVLCLVLPYLDRKTFLWMSILNKNLSSTSRRQRIISNSPKYRLNKKLETKIRLNMNDGQWDKISIKVANPRIVDNEFLKSWALNNYKLKLIKVCSYKFIAHCGCLVRRRCVHKRLIKSCNLNCNHAMRNIEYKTRYYVKYYKDILSYI
jgi:hypothetical protein